MCCFFFQYISFQCCEILLFLFKRLSLKSKSYSPPLNILGNILIQTLLLLQVLKSLLFSFIKLILFAGRIILLFLSQYILLGSCSVSHLRGKESPRFINACGWKGQQKLVEPQKITKIMVLSVNCTLGIEMGMSVLGLPYKHTAYIVRIG